LIQIKLPQGVLLYTQRLCISIIGDLEVRYNESGGSPGQKLREDIYYISLSVYLYIDTDIYIHTRMYSDIFREQIRLYNIG
jgi:hypothetical protein